MVPDDFKENTSKSYICKKAGKLNNNFGVYLLSGLNNKDINFFSIHHYNKNKIEKSEDQLKKYNENEIKKYKIELEKHNKNKINKCKTQLKKKLESIDACFFTNTKSMTVEINNKNILIPEPNILVTKKLNYKNVDNLYNTIIILSTYFKNLYDEN